MTADDQIYLGVDLGGTNIETAAVKNGQVLASSKINTQARKGADHVIDRIEKTVLMVAGKLDRPLPKFEAICIGAPGAVDLETGLVSDAPNLDWKNVPLGKLLSEKLGLPVLVDNDVNIGVLGEHVYGAGQGARHMVGIFVGTGIGGGIIINGEMLYGGRGAAGEIGHVVVEPGGRICGCGRQGCVEAYSSKTALSSMIRERIAEGEFSTLEKSITKKGNLRLTSAKIARALDHGDTLMEEALATSQYYLGLLTANLVNILDPEVVVFGGGLVEELGDDFLKPIRVTARKFYLQQVDAGRIQILPSALGDHAGPVGAAVAAERRLR